MADDRTTEELLQQIMRAAAAGRGTDLGAMRRVGHDFNNLIVAIGLHAELLELQPGLDEDGRRSVVAIREQVTRASALLRQVLDYGEREMVSTPSAPVPREADTMAPPITVVICDDHAVFAQGLSAILSREADLAVAGIAGTVAEMMELVNASQPDVLLLDYELPDADGVGAAIQVMQAHPGVQVVMLTAYSDPDVLLAAFEAGCSGYLSKNSGGQLVVDAVRRAAAGESVVSPLQLQHLLPLLKPSERAVVPALTARELQILGMLADGVPGPAIADRLYLSTNTVRNHVQSILTKLGAHSRLQAVAIAIQAGILRR